MNTETTMPTNAKVRWIGMAHVQPYSGNDLLRGAKAAMVAVVGDADDQLDFLSLVEREFRNIQFDVLSLDDVEPIALRMEKHQMPEDLRDAIQALSCESPLAFGTFHSYSERE
jgi:hypothetical protein